MHTRSLRTFVLSCSALFCAGVQAASFPEQPVTITVPYPPGSAADTTARLVAQGMSKELNTPVVVENRSGASGAIGTAAGARAKADGYHLTLVASPAVMTMLQMKQPGFDLEHDFAPVGLINEFFNALVVNHKLGIKTFAQLQDWIHAHPGRFNFATAGNATPSDYAGRQLARKHGLDMTFIPYQGSTPALMSVVSGESDGAVMVAGPAIAHIKSGQLTALSIMADQALKALPGVPDTNASGVHITTSGWTGLVAPKETPIDRIRVLNQALNQTLVGNKQLQETMDTYGGVLLPGSPEKLQQRVHDEIEQLRSDMQTLYKPS
ncbi:Bug family tripartite tricarboxylate transporter substrate binding protein [Alcaligenes sp. SDU_A2]|uniref:Bug family tripartite tricarboxylate transporter substrate binding protein n=1 Tax=Alcaligenes sp. SDU_A2 TaxID=3136634 RepID=UPI00311F8AF8